MQLSPQFTLELPDDWSHGREDDGRFWCGREDEPVTLFVRGHVQPGPIDERMAEVTAFLAEVPGRVGEVIEIRQEGGLTLTATIDHEEDGVPYRTFRWYVFKPSDDVVLLARFILSMPVDRAETAKSRELVEIVDGQARADSLQARDAERLPQLVERWRTLPASKREGCRLDLHRLCIAEPFGFIRVPAPAAWPDDGRDPGAGMWGVSGGPTADATLWVDYYLEPIHPKSDEILRLALLRGATHRGANARFDCPHEDGGWIAATFHEAEDNGEPRRYWRWNLAMRRDGGMCMVFIALNVGPTLAGTPDEALLVRLYDEAVPICEIDDPPPRCVPPRADRSRRR